MNLLDIELTNTLDLIRRKNLLSRTNTLKRFEKKLANRSGDIEKITSLIYEINITIESTGDHFLKAGL